MRPVYSAPCYGALLSPRRFPQTATIFLSVLRAFPSMSTPTSPTSSAPRAPMLSTSDALATLLGAASAVAGAETLPTFDALNRVLAADVVSPLDVPPMNTSAMDGYAVRIADLAQGEIGRAHV